MAQPAVIDLGSDFDPVEWVPTPPPVWWRRGWALLGYATLVLLLLGPPAPAHPGPLVPVAGIPTRGATTFALSSDTLYASGFVFTQPSLEQAPMPYHATLAAYRLSDAMLRWRVLLPLNPGNLLIRPSGTDTVVVSTLAEGATGDRTVAYDAASGRLLWASDLPLLPTVPVGTTAVLGAYWRPATAGAAGSAVPRNTEGLGEVPGDSPYATSPAAGDAPAMVLRGVQARTGTVIWAKGVPMGWSTALPAMTALRDQLSTWYAVMIAPDGSARSLDLSSGALSSPGHVRTGTRLLVVGRWLLVGYLRSGTPTLDGYRADTLTRQWSQTVRSLNLSVAPCGELTCLTDDEGTRAVDLDTGHTQWQVTAWQPVGTLGGWVYALPPGDQPPGDQRPASLLAPASGAPVLRLAGWVPVPAPATGPYLVRSVQSAGGPVARHTSAAWLGALRLATGTPQVALVAPLADLAVDGCAAVPGFVVCGIGDSRLWVWRYRG